MVKKTAHDFVVGQGGVGYNEEQQKEGELCQMQYCLQPETLVRTQTHTNTCMHTHA